MSESVLFQEIASFIERKFGASIASGYYLQGLQECPMRLVTEPEAVQSLADRLCEQPTWLVATSIDPLLITSATQLEHRTVTTQPEWSPPEEFIQYLATLNGRIDIGRLRRSGVPSVHSLTLIQPEKEIVLEVNAPTASRVYATRDDTLSAILKAS